MFSLLNCLTQDTECTQFILDLVVAELVGAEISKLGKGVGGKIEGTDYHSGDDEIGPLFQLLGGWVLGGLHKHPKGLNQ